MKIGQQIKFSWSRILNKDLTLAREIIYYHENSYFFIDLIIKILSEASHLCHFIMI